MRKVKRWRYYCDFCKKSGGNSLAKHEKHCTGNPNRECRMCNCNPPTAELIAAVGSGGPEGLERLRKAADDCPACILAGIRQSKINHPDPEIGGGDGSYIEFDYKKEAMTFWANQEPDYGGYY